MKKFHCKQEASNCKQKNRIRDFWVLPRQGVFPGLGSAVEPQRLGLEMTGKRLKPLPLRYAICPTRYRAWAIKHTQRFHLNVTRIFRGICHFISSRCPLGGCLLGFPNCPAFCSSILILPSSPKGSHTRKNVAVCVDVGKVVV